MPAVTIFYACRLDTDSRASHFDTLEELASWINPTEGKPMAEAETGMNWGEVAVTAGICLAIVAVVLALPPVRSYLASSSSSQPAA